MSMPITTLGIVDVYEGEQVETDFTTLLGLVPLAPVASYYRRSDDQRYPIELSGRSVAKAVLSQHGLYATILSLGFGLVHASAPHGELLLLAGVAFGLLTAFGRLRLGKPTPAALRRRATHLELTGVSALPRMLPTELTTSLRDALQRKWAKRHRGQDWREATPAEGQLKLFAVLAALEAEIEPSPEARTRAEEAWSALEAAAPEEGTLESLSPEEAWKVLERPQAETPANTGRKSKGSRSRGIKIRCERCEHVTRVPKSCAGRTGRCPSCQRGVRVPSRESMRLRAA